MMLMKSFFTLLGLCTAFIAHTQTVGLLLNSPEAFDGYTLVAPTGATRTHLIDNCGRVINQWDSNYRAGESAYLLEDGSLLRTCRVASTVFNGGGIGGRIERYSWEGDLIWSYNMANDQRHHHHDMAWLPNGNVVLMAWEFKSAEEAAAAGREIEGSIWPPVLIEVQPSGSEGGSIVWEWHAWDHLIQDSDPSLPNYGDPAEHVERFDVNYGSASGGSLPGQSGGDWFHCNAVSHHPEHDLLMLNSRNWNEFYIIDHDISAFAATGPEGDLLYRWGNPATYGRGLPSDRVFFGQHDPHWILDDGPTALGGDPSQTVLIYNNGNGRPSGNGSTVEELTLPWNPSAANGHYSAPANQDSDSPFEPSFLDWSWPENPSLDFYSSKISGSQRQPNGNTLICEGASGHLFEINETGETVWEYYTAYNQFGAINQGDAPFSNSTFRAYRYAPDYPAFDNRDLTPGDPVEANPQAFDCTLYPDNTASTIEVNEGLAWTAFPNPSDGHFVIQSSEAGRWSLSDGWGRTRAEGILSPGKNTIQQGHISSGAYVVRVHDFSGRPMGTHRLHIIR